MARRHHRFHVHFTPTGSSLINQVERWCGYLTDQKIRAVERDPRPFACTKTAEEIHNSLTEIYPRFQADDTSDYPAQVEPSLLHFDACLSARGVAWRPCMGRKP